MKLGLLLVGAAVLIGGYWSPTTAITPAPERSAAQECPPASHRRIPYSADNGPEHRVRLTLRAYRDGRLIWYNSVITMEQLRTYLRRTQAFSPLPYLVLAYEEGIDCTVLASLRRTFDDDGGCSGETFCSERRVRAGNGGGALPARARARAAPPPSEGEPALVAPPRPGRPIPPLTFVPAHTSQLASTAPRLSLCNLPEVSEPVVLDAYFVAPDFETMVLADPACPGAQNRVVRIAGTVNRNAVRFIAREAHAGRPFGRSVRARVEGQAQLTHGERYFLVGSVSQLSVVQYQLPQEIPPPPQ